ncbi:HNH endonuclease [Bacillus infantis]|uniref:Putative HNH nuclease YajD n=1 Tax=Bacillus infantis TaxID=324767 RepID=A0A5D4RFB3_9BACI|nr:HNH endonuclease signature motif containing protein [Bacillus infantis]TYS50095.1 HNH endonuclease [Bacillus infantis]
MAMLKLCSCGTPIDISLNCCEGCKPKQGERHKLYDRYRRDQETAAFYKSTPWRKVREQALARDIGLCQHCLSKGRIKWADMVDHIIPIKEAWELRLVLDNLQSLCNSCHNIKTAEDKKKYARPLGP